MSHSSSSELPSINPKRERLKFTTKLAYGAGDMGPAVTANVLVFFLLYFFTDVAGLSPGFAGSILMIGKISDAINDPIVGVLSDRTSSRWGRRIPWIVWGAIPFGILFLLQWIVPNISDNDTVNDWWLFSYYVIIGILFNIVYTIVNLPYTALTPELTQDYNERTSLNSFRFAFSIGGSILSLILAQVIFSVFPNNGLWQYFILAFICSIISILALFWCVAIIQERGRDPILSYRSKKLLGNFLTPVGIILVIYGVAKIVLSTEKLNLIAILAILFGLMIVAFGLTLLFYRPEENLTDRRAHQEQDSETTNPSLPLQQQIKIAFTNKPFLYVIGIYLCSWLAVQLTASILIYFVVSWMGIPESNFPLVAIAVQGTALVMLFFWKWVSEKVGKKAVYFMGTAIWIIAQAGLFFIQPGQVSLLYILAILAGVGVSVAYLIPWSMLPDVIDLDELQTGQRREGVFYAFMVFLQKMGLALGLFVVGIVLEAAGFIERLPGEPIPVQPESALLAIRIAVAPLPMIALVGGIILAYFYPISQQVHAEIMLKLQERKNEG